MADAALATLYKFRFPERVLQRKANIWKVLCRDFFQRYIPEDSTVLDLACGYGEFINHISARKKIGVDLNPDTAQFLDKSVQLVTARADQTAQADNSVDVVFTSNFFEHLPNKTALDGVFAEIRRILKPGGRLIVMGPNLKYVREAYWDYYDHHLPLTHQSLEEGLVQSGFAVERMIPRFLPYTTKSALPQAPWLVSLFLHVPLAWPVLGKQFLAVARKPV